MIKSQRRQFPRYEAAYKRAQITLVFGIVARAIGVAGLSVFLWAAANGDVIFHPAILVILALGALGGALAMVDQILSRIRTFAMRVSVEAYAADPRARAARDAGAKAYAEAARAGASDLAAKAAHDAAFAAFVESNPAASYAGDLPDATVGADMRRHAS